jgi:hypothetical protein
MHAIISVGSKRLVTDMKYFAVLMLFGPWLTWILWAYPGNSTYTVFFSADVISELFTLNPDCTIEIEN